MALAVKLQCNNRCYLTLLTQTPYREHVGLAQSRVGWHDGLLGGCRVRIAQVCKGVNVSPRLQVLRHSDGCPLPVVP